MKCVADKLSGDADAAGWTPLLCYNGGGCTGKGHPAWPRTEPRECTDRRQKALVGDLTVLVRSMSRAKKRYFINKETALNVKDGVHKKYVCNLFNKNYFPSPFSSEKMQFT